MVPEMVQDQKLGYNPPHMVVMLIDKVVMCSGCEIPFNRKDRQEPNTFLNTWCSEHD